MTKSCTLIIKDQVNVSFIGLDPTTRRECNKKLKFFIHAARYMPSVRLGRWDGCISFFSISGNTYLPLLDKILPIIVDAGYEITIDDLRPIHNFEFPLITNEYFSDYANNPIWPADHQLAGKPILLRDHQVDVINAAIENPQSLQEVATGAGKTLITAALSHLCEPYGRTIVIVPNVDLVKQTETDYLNIGLDVGVYFGHRKDFGKKHTICTWQSLEVIQKKEKDGTGSFTLAEFTKDVICVIVDEAHQSKAEVLQSLLCKSLPHIPIRWGLTGTIPKEEHSAMAILIGLGPVVNRLAARELMDIGILSRCHIHIIQMQDVVEYSSFHEENHYLVTNPTRLDWISQMIIDRTKQGNTLVLVNRIETGRELELRVPDSVFVYGGTKTDDRKDSYDSVASGNNVPIIATYGVAAVGINIPRIFNLILIEPGKSFIKVVQSIGRGLRTSKDKDFINIYDIGSTCKFSAKHIAERKKTYKSAQYPFTLEKIDYVDQLSTGLISLKGK